MTRLAVAMFAGAMIGIMLVIGIEVGSKCPVAVRHARELVFLSRGHALQHEAGVKALERRIERLEGLPAAPVQYGRAPAAGGR